MENLLQNSFFEKDILKKFPNFEFDDFKLREISPFSDSLFFFKYINDPKVRRFIASEDLPENVELAKKELNYWYNLYVYKRSIFWGIADSATNQLIGTVGFNYLSQAHKRAEVSYDLDHNYWNRGIMTRALSQICEIAKNDFELNRIQANVAVDNYASIKVLTKLGFEKEALLKKYGILHGEAKDFFIYSIIN